MIVLGIDPGSRRTGYCLIEVRGEHQALLDAGVVDLSNVDDHHLRLKQIYERMTAIIEVAKPDECAVEMPVFGKNPQSMLKLGRAQAAAILAALNLQIPVAQYTPKEVKKSVTGRGNASKKQVLHMVRSILAIAPTIELMHDASDAIAVGLCHVHRPAGNRISRGKRAGSWERFVKANPDRIG